MKANPRFLGAQEMWSSKFCMTKSWRRLPQPSYIRKWHFAVCKSSFIFFTPCDPVTAIWQEEIQKPKWWPRVTAVEVGGTGAHANPLTCPQPLLTPWMDLPSGPRISGVSLSWKESRKHIPRRGLRGPQASVPVDVRGAVPRGTGLSAASLFLPRRWESRGR